MWRAWKLYFNFLYSAFSEIFEAFRAANNKIILFITEIFDESQIFFVFILKNKMATAGRTYKCSRFPGTHISVLNYFHDIFSSVPLLFR